MEQKLPNSRPKSHPKSYKDEAMHSTKKWAFTLVGYVLGNSFSSSSIRLILEALYSVLELKRDDYPKSEDVLKGSICNGNRNLIWYLFKR